MFEWGTHNGNQSATNHNTVSGSVTIPLACSDILFVSAIPNTSSGDVYTIDGKGTTTFNYTGVDCYTGASVFDKFDYFLVAI